jgi:2-methylcitrate dehydratase PrpD
MTSAQLNLPYCVATLLLEGDVFVDQFRDDMIADPARMALARKVEVIEDPKITALGSKFRHKVSVAVHLKDGTVLEETVEAPRGSEQTFATAADIQAKFVKLTRRVLPQAQIDRIMNLVLDVENLHDISVLIKALART